MGLTRSALTTPQKRPKIDAPRMTAWAMDAVKKSGATSEGVASSPARLAMLSCMLTQRMRFLLFNINDSVIKTTYLIQTYSN